MLSSAKVEVLENTVNYEEFAKNKCLTINSCIDSIYRNWVNSYEEFYGINPNGGSRHSSEEFERILRFIPVASLVKILRNSSSFIELIDTIAPGELPNKYRSPAFEVSFSSSGVVVGPLKPGWQEKESTQEEEPNVL
jgi:hypothetical protein